ncbi:MAG: WecB/TagA/CpsF family glycosyltransferase [Actinomycetales bacterium]
MAAEGELQARVDDITIDLMSRPAVLDHMRRALSGDRPPLVLMSANLDHVHSFATRHRLPTGRHRGVDFVTLLDGQPVARAVRRQTNGARAEVVPGSELLEPALEFAAASQSRVVLVGASDRTRKLWRTDLPRRFPGIAGPETFAVHWADYDAPGGSAALATRVAAAQPDLVVVSLGKPRQELWLRDHVAELGCRLALAFGSAADYLVGTQTRPPAFVRRPGLEWLVRLAREPRRLGPRYLLQAPPALRVVRRQLTVHERVGGEPVTAEDHGRDVRPTPRSS